MDGVMQAPGGPSEDPTRAFKFGGWQMPYFDHEFGQELDLVFKEKFDLLLGRKTYEIFATYWPSYDEDGSDGGIAKRFNEIKKYAVSSSGEVVYELAGLGAPPRHRRREASEARGRPYPRHPGSTELVHAVPANDVVDAMTIFTVFGGGKKLFADGSVPHSFKLTSSPVSSTGVLIGHYERDGVQDRRRRARFTQQA
jgi:hypothetical protein